MGARGEQRTPPGRAVHADHEPEAVAHRGADQAVAVADHHGVLRLDGQPAGGEQQGRRRRVPVRAARPRGPVRGGIGGDHDVRRRVGRQLRVDGDQGGEHPLGAQPGEERGRVGPVTGVQGAGTRAYRDRPGFLARAGAVLGARCRPRGSEGEHDRPVGAPAVAGGLLLDAAHAVIVPPAPVTRPGPCA